MSSPTRTSPTKERLGQFIHHSVVSLGIAALILISVVLVFVQLFLSPTDPVQAPLETIQVVITVLFALELGIKYYVAPDKIRYVSQYWIDLIAIIPWAQSLRVLRVLRLLRVFRVAMILSRRISFISSLFRSAVGEYLVLAIIMLLFLGVGTFALYNSERHARTAQLEELRQSLPPDEFAAARDALEAQGSLADPESALWATVFFLVATEPMIAQPESTVGRAVTLVVMFGGLTTFAIFTGVVTALMVNRLKRRLEIDDMDRFQLVDHLVICGWNRLVPLMLEEFQQAPNFDPQIVIVAELDDLPPEIARLERGARVFFVRGDCTKPEVLEQARIQHASRAVIVADNSRDRSAQDRDARTVLASLMIERMCPGIYTCAQLLNRDNEPHLRAAGIEEVILTSEAGGHHLAIATMNFGLSQVLDTLMTAKIGPILEKVPVPQDLIGQPFVSALEHYKRTHDSIPIGVEILGQDGPRTEGYALQVNPAHQTILGERDNLVLIGKAPNA